MFCLAVSSSGKSDTLMSAGTCSFTCQDFMNMKNSLLQIKLRLGNTQSENQVTCGQAYVYIYIFFFTKMSYSKTATY